MRVDCAIYEEGERRDVADGDLTGALRAARAQDGYLWLGLHDPSREEIDAVQGAFGLHPLAIDVFSPGRSNPAERIFSAWVAILAVPTMIAAIYGMNFKFMPELESPYGYPAGWW